MEQKLKMLIETTLFEYSFNEWGYKIDEYGESIYPEYTASLECGTAYLYVDASDFSNKNRIMQIYNLYNLEIGNGNASKLMNQLINCADKLNIVLSLSCYAKKLNNEYIGLTQPELISFYERKGFTFENKEQNYPLGIRMPK